MPCSLPLPAVGVLFADLELGRVPQPFEVPHVSTELDQRAQIRDAVYRTLANRGLARGSRLHPDVEDMLVTFARAPLAIAIAGELDRSGHDGGEPLFARACSDGRDAFMVVQRGTMLVFTEIRPTAMADAAVDLLPDIRQAMGGPVSIPATAPAPAAADDEYYDPFARMREQRPSAQHRALQRIVSQPILSIGAFTPTVAAQSGSSAPVVWLDTVQEIDQRPGRHFATSRQGPDGKTWTTYTPGDNARIAHYLREHVGP
ncbi:MAG: ESX secretion-associated protein EspG [Haloechinothrix sp.]